MNTSIDYCCLPVVSYCSTVISMRMMDFNSEEVFTIVLIMNVTEIVNVAFPTGCLLTNFIGL